MNEDDNYQMEGRRMKEKKKKIFINASDTGYDSEIARVFVSGFNSAGVKTWYMPDDAAGGMKKSVEIRKQIRLADYFLALSSESSVKSGLHIRSIRDALDEMREMPPGEIFILPVWTGDPSNYEANKYSLLLDDIKPFILFPDWQKTIDGIFKIIGVPQPEMKIPRIS